MGKIASSTIYRWVYGGNLRAHNRAPAEGQAPETSADLRAHQRRFDHPGPPVGSAHTRDVRALEAKHGGLNTREGEGLHRGERAHTADQGPHRGLDKGNDSCITWRADEFRRPVLVMAT